MKTISVVLLSSLLCSALSAPVKVNEESSAMFLGEDFHIPLSSINAEVTFRARTPPRSAEVDLMRGGVVVSSRVKLNAFLSHLIVDAVAKEDEGVYAVKNSERPDLDRRITLSVRDCSIEQNVMYGDNFHIQLSGVTPPITLEYRPSAAEADQTPRSALVLLTSTGLAREGYQGRVSANEQHVELRAATGADQGSYTIRDAEGTVKRKVCLNIKEHHNFNLLPYASTLKINLILNSSMVFYTPNYDSRNHLLLNNGELTSAETELGLEGRLSLEGSVLTLKQVKGADAGLFKVTDQLGFAVSNVYLEVQPYKLPTLYVAIIALVGLLVFLLLVCLLSCLIKVKKRAKRAAALEKIAESAGKEDDGKAFAQVVKEITHLNEESKHSQADNTEKSQSTEVDIKGLEVSSKEVLDGANLETSDSGVEFNTTGLPLDTDTDAPDQIPDSEAISVSFATPVKASPPAPVETKPSAPPVEVKPIPVPEVKPSTPPVEVKPVPAPEVKPSPPLVEVKPIPAPEVKPIPVPEVKASPPPETKKTPDPPAEPKLSLPKPVDTKLSPIPSPEPKPAPSPISTLSPSDGLEAKTPEPKAAPTPSPEPKPTSLLAPSPKTTAPSTPEPTPISSLAASPKTTAPPTPEPKAALTPAMAPAPSTPEPTPISSLTASPKTTAPPTPEPKAALTPTPAPKAVTPEPAPTTNGTPEPAPESKPSLVPSPAAPKATPPKTPEVEVNSAAEAKGDGPPAGAEETTAATTTT